jgi:hypothetical protein
MTVDFLSYKSSPKHKIASNNYKNKNSLIMQEFRQKLAEIREQNKLNKHINQWTRAALSNIIGLENTHSKIEPVSYNNRKLNEIENDYLPSSKTRQKLRNFVAYRQNFMQHANYWQQIWLFTDNPVYEYGI